LEPAQVTQAGYRLYDDAAIQRLSQILLFRELGFSLREIQLILADGAFDADAAIEKQVCLLEQKKEQLHHRERRWQAGLTCAKEIAHLVF
jgi:DNA-binding transcriptional MerR regulator